MAGFFDSDQNIRLIIILAGSFLGYHLQKPYYEIFNPINYDIISIYVSKY